MSGIYPKRLLVTCHHLVSVGGTELYTYYLLKALKSLPGLCLEYFTHHRGEMSRRIERELGVGFKRGNRYDLILASHNSTVDYLFGQGPIVQICHGPIPDLEQPSPLADRHVAVSEEVAQHLDSEGFGSTVILNGVDMDVFMPVEPLAPEVRTILSLCQSDEANQVIAEACDRENILFRSINKHKNPKFGLVGEINDADMVVGIGRSAYDAMACGRPCLLFDIRAYNGSLGDGYLFPDKFGRYVKHNCSGRYSRRAFDVDGLIKEINHYDPTHGSVLRRIAEDKLDLGKNTARLLEIGRRIDGWDHWIHGVQVQVSRKESAGVFTKLKRMFRGKMNDAAEAGSSAHVVFNLICQERFPWKIRLSLYAYWLKLWFKGKFSSE